MWPDPDTTEIVLCALPRPGTALRLLAMVAFALAAWSLSPARGGAPR